MLNFRTFPSITSLAQAASALLCERIAQRPNLTLGLATGSTMEPIYERFCQEVGEKGLDLSTVTTFNLDEYIGLEPSHPESYHFYMQHFLFSKLAFDQSRTHLPGLIGEDVLQCCKDYSAAMANHGGVDVQLLGIGSNGHIGFNEPGTSFASRTHVVELSEQTRRDNGRFFASMDEVPTHAITMGLQEIMEAKEVLLVATGLHKAPIMSALYHSEVTENLPASVLRDHPNVHVFLDPEAASLLPESVRQPL